MSGGKPLLPFIVSTPPFLNLSFFNLALLHFQTTSYANFKFRISGIFNFGIGAFLDLDACQILILDFLISV